MPAAPSAATPRLVAEAGAAAVSAGVQVRELVAAEMPGASALFARVWQTDPLASPMEPGMLIALGFAGSYVSGAFDRSGDLVGACAGFFGTPLGAVLHSHIAAVRPGGPRGTGTALKLHQRAWCAARGVGTIAWTFDPLIARNAWFNLGRLAVHVEDYLVDFYGRMDDGLNAGEESDRLLVHWAVDPAEQASTAAPAGSYAVLRVGDGGAPDADLAVPAAARSVTLAVPADVEALRASDPTTASRWRTSFRDAYLTLRGQGWRPVGFARTDHHYLLERR